MPSASPLIIAALAAIALGGAAMATLGARVVRVARSPLHRIRSMARRNVPLRDIARKTGLPQDVVRSALSAPSQSAPAQRLPARREPLRVKPELMPTRVQRKPAALRVVRTAAR